MSLDDHSEQRAEALAVATRELWANQADYRVLVDQCEQHADAVIAGMDLFRKAREAFAMITPHVATGESVEWLDTKVAVSNGLDRADLLRRRLLDALSDPIDDIERQLR